MISNVPSWTVSPSNNIQINSVAIDGDGERCIFGSSSEFDSGCFAVYCYNEKGKELWSQPISKTPSYQGVFWVAISHNGRYAAAGGEFTKTDGFLKAYSVDTGNILLDVKLKARVNQVSLSHDGHLLLAVFDDTVQLYHLDIVTNTYKLTSDETLEGFSCNSGVLANNGHHAVISAIKYTGNTTSGKVAAFNIVENKLSPLSECALAVGSMRVAITDSGENWGASLHDGSCVAFTLDNPATPLWLYKPDVAGLELAYGFDMTETESGKVLLAVGANKSGVKQGYVYLVESNDTEGQFQWGADLEFAANPGISLDRNGTYVTATDGKPTNEKIKHVKESPGHFYLFDGNTGNQEWLVKTSLMNWPMMINQNGDRIIGASDNGTAYFWEKIR